MRSGFLVEDDESLLFFWWALIDSGIPAFRDF